MDGADRRLPRIGVRVVQSGTHLFAFMNRRLLSKSCPTHHQRGGAIAAMLFSRRLTWLYRPRAIECRGQITLVRSVSSQIVAAGTLEHLKNADFGNLPRLVISLCQQLLNNSKSPPQWSGLMVCSAV